MALERVKITVERQDGKGLNTVVSLPLDKLRQSSLYGGLLECYSQDDVLPFPTQYNSALPHYIDYCHHDNKIRVTVRRLKMCFDLAHFLGDNGFFQALVQCLIRAWPVSSTIIDQCNETIQRQVYMSLPFMYIPACYRHDSTFVLCWIRANLDKEITGPYEVKYRTRIDFADIPQDKWDNEYKELLSFSSHVSWGPRGGNSYFDKHGFRQLWYPPSGEGKQYLAAENFHLYNKEIGIQRMWSDTGTLHKEVESGVDNGVIVLRGFNNKKVKKYLRLNPSLPSTVSSATHNDESIVSS